MSPARVAFASAALFALVRFFVTPTWPCAFVIAVVLVLALSLEAVRVIAAAQVGAAEEEALKTLADRVEVVEARLTANVTAVNETRAKVDTLASRRAFGG